MALEEIRESYYRLEQDYIKQKELLTKVEARVRELEDQLRWRKWPEEKPEARGRYLVLTDGSTGIGNHVSYYSAGIGWATSDAGISHWRPIGPLPGGE
jgi:hypothetical protein